MAQSHEDVTTVVFVAFYDVMGRASDGHDLSDVLSQASWFRMDLRKEELEHGARDLIAAGLLEADDGALARTEAGLKLWTELKPERRRSVEERAPYWRPIEIAQAHLGSIDCVAARGGWSVPDEDFEAARRDMKRRMDSWQSRSS